MKMIGCLLIVLLSLVNPSTAGAQDFPSKPVRIIAPFPPGGGVELIARYLCDKLALSFGQPCIVENKSGAGGIIGLNYVAKAEPDGYTIVIIANQLSIIPSLYANVPFDVFRDLTPIALVTRTPMVIGANPSFPAKSFSEFITYAKSNPGKVNFTTCGVGSPQHLAGAFLSARAGIQITHIPYKGCGEAIRDVLGGQVPIFISTLAVFSPYLKTGTLRAFAIISDQRSPLAPDLPTVAEEGFPGFTADVWMGLLAPGKTPQSVVTRLNVEINRVLALPDLRAKLTDQTYEIVGGPSQLFADVIRTDYERYGKVIRQFGIKPE